MKLGKMACSHTPSHCYLSNQHEVIQYTQLPVIPIINKHR